MGNEFVELGAVGHFGRNYLQLRVSSDCFEVVQGPSGAIVDDDHRLPSVKQPLHQVRTYKPRTACDEDVFVFVQSRSQAPLIGESLGHCLGQLLPVIRLGDESCFRRIRQVTAFNEDRGAILAAQDPHKPSAPHPAIAAAGLVNEGSMEAGGKVVILGIKGIIRENVGRIVFVASR